MANDLIPMPGQRPDSDGHSNGHGANGHSNGTVHGPHDGQVWDPTVPMGFVDTDAQSAGGNWDLPPEETPWKGFEVARQARRDAQQAEEDSEWGRRHGLHHYARLRATDAADDRQSGWDWGNFRTWAIIFAMFFGFLLFSAFVYYLPQGRHNQNDGPMPVPGIRVYTCVQELSGL